MPLLFAPLPVHIETIFSSFRSIKAKQTHPWCSNCQCYPIYSQNPFPYPKPINVHAMSRLFRYAMPSDPWGNEKKKH